MLVKKLSATLPDSKTRKNVHLVDKKERIPNLVKQLRCQKKKTVVSSPLFLFSNYVYIVCCYFFCVADK